MEEEELLVERTHLLRIPANQNKVLRSELVLAVVGESALKRAMNTASDKGRVHERRGEKKTWNSHPNLEAQPIKAITPRQCKDSSTHQMQVLILRHCTG